MNAVTKVVILFSLFSTAQSGAGSYAACVAACNTLWYTCVTCVVGVGAALAVFTGGVAAAAPIAGCTYAYEVCIASCIVPAAAVALP